LIESKHDVSETFNNYLENAQCSVKLSAGSLSPVSITVKFKYLFDINDIHKNTDKTRKRSLVSWLIIIYCELYLYIYV